MKNNSESSLDLETIWAWVGGILLLLSPFIFIWLIGTSSSSQESEMTPQESAQYEDYKSDQILNENGAQEACIDRMDRDVKRYGEGVIGTYDCSQ